MSASAQIHLIHTSCRDCVFATYEGQTQTGCVLGRIDTFKEQDVVLEAYDTTKEFFVVNGRRCVSFRSQEWAAKHSGQKPSLPFILRKEISLQVDAILLLEEPVQEEAVGLTLASIRAQNLPFRGVYVISNQATVPVGRLHARLNQWAEGLSWFLTDIQQRDAEGVPLSRGAALDAVNSKLKSPYYAVFTPGFRVPETFVADLDIAIHDRLERFVVLLPAADGNALVVQTAFHRNHTIVGNEVAHVTNADGTVDRVLDSVQAKAVYLAELTGAPHMVGLAAKICQGLELTEAQALTKEWDE